MADTDPDATSTPEETPEVHAWRLMTDLTTTTKRVLEDSPDPPTGIFNVTASLTAALASSLLTPQEAEELLRTLGETIVTASTHIAGIIKEMNDG